VFIAPSPLILGTLLALVLFISKNMIVAGEFSRCQEMSPISGAKNL
jgi:hypothetical protein